MVGLSLLGYVKVMLFIRRITFVRDFTPSSGPGTGKVKAMVSLLSSKYAFFSGYFSTNWLRVLPFSPLKVFSLRSWKSMMWVHILSKKGLKCEVQMMLPLKLSSQSSSHLMLSTSKWPVGSSSMSTSAFMSCAAQSCIIIFLHRRLQLVHLVAGVHHPPPPRLVHAQDRESVVLHPDLLVLDLVLHEDTLQLVPLREALKLLVGNRAHQRRLPALVRPKEPVEPVPLQVHLRVPEQGQRPVGQGERALVEVDPFRVLFLDLLLWLRGHLHLRPDTLNHSGEGILGAHVSLPCCRIEVPHVRRRGRKSSHVGGLLALGLVPEALLQDLQSLLLLDHDLVARSLRGLLQSVVRPL